MNILNALRGLFLSRFRKTYAKRSKVPVVSEEVVNDGSGANGALAICTTDVVQQLIECYRQDDTDIMKEDSWRNTIVHDGQVHHPLGAGGYVWQRNFIPSLIQGSGCHSIVWHVDPFNPVCGALAFSLAAYTQTTNSELRSEIAIRFDASRSQPDVQEGLSALAEGAGVSYRWTTLEGTPNALGVALFIIMNRDSLNHKPLVYMPCVGVNCLETCVAYNIRARYIITNDEAEEEASVSNVAQYIGEHIYSPIPRAAIDADIEVELEFCCVDGHRNTQHLSTQDNQTLPSGIWFDEMTTHLIQSILYPSVAPSSDGRQSVLHIHILPASCSGTTHEQHLWGALMKLRSHQRQLSPPIVVYAPEIVDWAGTPAPLDFQTLNDVQLGHIQKLKRLIDGWVADPKQLFRYWSNSFLDDFVFNSAAATSNDSGTYRIIHDGVLHPSPPSPFNFVQAVQKTFVQARDKRVIIHIGAQPNNSPHTGTIVVFASAFARAKQIQDADSSIRAIVSLDLVDTAPDASKTMTRDGVTYQQSHRATAAMRKFLPDYDEVMSALAKEFDDIEWRKTYQEDLLGAEKMPAVMRWVVENNAWLGPRLAPEREKLCIRSRCPRDGCAWADKHGIKSKFIVDGRVVNASRDAVEEARTLDECLALFHEEINTQIVFTCPDHGEYLIDFGKKEDVQLLEFHTPLRNLVRTIIQGLDAIEVRGNSDGRDQVLHMRVTGNDYSGMYQERLLWSPLIQLGVPIAPPMIVYAPLIVDWAGSKLSKSLYVKEGAYQYLKDKGMDYLLSYSNMKAMGKDPLALAKMVRDIIGSGNEGASERPYSVDYVHGSIFGRMVGIEGED